MSKANNKRRTKMTFILIGLLVSWALLLAVGTLTSDPINWLRPLFILGTIGTFVAIWLIALWRAG